MSNPFTRNKEGKMKTLYEFDAATGDHVKFVTDGNEIFQRIGDDLAPQAVRTYDGVIISLKKSVLCYIKNTSYVKTLIRGKYYRELADAVIKELFPED